MTSQVAPAMRKTRPMMMPGSIFEVVSVNSPSLSASIDERMMNRKTSSDQKREAASKPNETPAVAPTSKMNSRLLPNGEPTSTPTPMPTNSRLAKAMHWPAKLLTKGVRSAARSDVGPARAVT